MDNDTIIYFGGSVKALGDGRIGGHLVIFGDADNTDLEGDYFTKDTDFGAHQTTMVFYQHGMDPALQRRVLDPQASIKTDEVGIWAEAQLELRDEYEKRIYAMAEAGKLGWSSGTAPHLIDREKKSDNAYHITRWPLGLDASLTPTPAEPRTAAIPLKSIEFPHIDVAPEDTGEVSAQTVDVNINVTVPEVKTMDEVKEQVQPDAEPSVEYATKDEMSGLQQSVDRVLDIIEKLEKAGPLKDAGYIAPDDERGKKEVKSLGDFLIAVYRGNVKRLNDVYGARKDMSGDTGTAGGYLVPEQFTNQLLQVQMETSPILPRVTRVPVNTDTGRYPALDQFVTPTAGSGNTALATGVTAVTTAAGGNLTETTPAFEQLQWNVNKIGGFTYVENELRADSAQAIETLLTGLFGIAVSSKIEHYILRGTGAGEPEGILNATAAVSVTVDTDNAFAWADATEMFSRFKRIGGSGPVWLIHPGIWPDIGDFETSNGGGVFQANMQQGLGQSLLGYPILQSEHLPQDDNAGCVILADLSAYLLFERSGLMVDFSEHYQFISDRGTFRFTQRLDGMTWLSNAITLADPQGSFTVSPFVYLND